MHFKILVNFNFKFLTIHGCLPCKTLTNNASSWKVFNLSLRMILTKNNCDSICFRMSNLTKRLCSLMSSRYTMLIKLKGSYLGFLCGTGVQIQSPAFTNLGSPFCLFLGTHFPFILSGRLMGIPLLKYILKLEKTKIHLIKLMILILKSIDNVTLINITDKTN